jgi:hypothetical protein
MPPRSRRQRPQASARANPDESPLAWLARRRDKTGEPLISPTQLLAGEKLRRDFTFAQLMPRVTTRYAATGASASGRSAAPGVGVELADNVVAAGERVRRALAAVGPELSGVLVDVCCHLKGLEQAERAANWPQRSGKVVLQLALTRLARHYCIDVASDAPGRTSQWGAEGYRPVLSMPQQGAEDP